MGLDIDLCDSDGHPICSINWLRNPFGLQRAVEDNLKKLGDARIADGKMTLYQVCNKWSYKESENVDRAVFLETVKTYYDAFNALEDVRLHFNLMEYCQFVQPRFDRLKKSYTGMWIDGYKIEADGRMSLPTSVSNALINQDCSFQFYKTWLGQLYDLAVKLQDPSTRVYCEN